MHNLNSGKRSPKMLATSVHNFKKLPKNKQLPKGQKSGNPESNAVSYAFSIPSHIWHRIILHFVQ
jgi:hypothetical protein